MPCFTARIERCSRGRRHRVPPAAGGGRFVLPAGPPRLEPVDPRLLWATQPWLVRHHAAYYVSGRWERTGTTSADMGAAGNRYPIVTVDPAGRHVIRTGHHRSFAALVSGRLVFARVFRPELSPAVEPDEFVVTPHLRVNTTATSRDLSLDRAARALDGGQVAFVDGLDAARATLAVVGLDDDQIDDRISMATSGRAAQSR